MKEIIRSRGILKEVTNTEILRRCRAGDLRRFPTLVDIHTDSGDRVVYPLVRQGRSISDTIHLHTLW